MNINRIYNLRQKEKEFNANFERQSAGIIKRNGLLFIKIFGQ
jgi:hypothetical protein